MCLVDFRYVVAWLSCCTKIFCGGHKKRFVGVSLTDCTLGSRGYFFLMDTDGSRRQQSADRRKSVSGALSNRKHGLFHIRYFENGPLEPE